MLGNLWGLAVGKSSSSTSWHRGGREGEPEEEILQISTHKQNKNQPVSLPLSLSLSPLFLCFPYLWISPLSLSLCLPSFSPSLPYLSLSPPTSLSLFVYIFTFPLLYSLFIHSQLSLKHCYKYILTDMFSSNSVLHTYILCSMPGSYRLYKACKTVLNPPLFLQHNNKYKILKGKESGNTILLLLCKQIWTFFVAITVQ